MEKSRLLSFNLAFEDDGIIDARKQHKLNTCRKRLLKGKALQSSPPTKDLQLTKLYDQQAHFGTGIV